MSQTLFFADFRQACRKKGCPFCTLALEHTQRYLRYLLNEFALAPDVHQSMAQSRGFCNAHGWLLQRVEQAMEGDGMGTAILYATVVKRLRDDLEDCLARSHWGRTSFAAVARERLQPQDICLVCKHQAQNERFARAQLLDDLVESDFQSDLAQFYRASAGACLPHFLALLEQAPAESVARWLTEVQREKAAELAAELDEYVRKQDVRYKDEPKGAEKDSWIRVIEHTAGKRDVTAGRATPK